MRVQWSVCLAICLLLTASCGQRLTVEEFPCATKAAVPVKSFFTKAKHSYVFQGSCDLTHTRAQLPVTVVWTAEGTYERTTGIATEVFSVPAPKPSEPSRPYGTFRSAFRCKTDPWLFARPNHTRMECDPIGASVNPPLNSYHPKFGAQSRAFLTEILSTISHLKQPYSTWVVWYTSSKDPGVANAWQALESKYQNFLAAEKKDQQLRQGSAQSPSSSFRANLAPSILRPAAGQHFFIKTPVPIKLAPPDGWTVAGYMIRLEKRDVRGNWIPQSTIPVGAVQGESAGGYMGFGAGTAPTFETSAGTWRLSAQASNPHQSGWSNWVEFSVGTPPPSGALDKSILRRPQ